MILNRLSQTLKTHAYACACIRSSTFSVIATLGKIAGCEAWEDFENFAIAKHDFLAAFYICRKAHRQDD
jgi:hypothetical protein